jgi:hypothetical protein
MNRSGNTRALLTAMLLGCLAASPAAHAGARDIEHLADLAAQVFCKPGNDARCDEVHAFRKGGTPKLAAGRSIAVGHLHPPGADAQPAFVALFIDSSAKIPRVSLQTLTPANEIERGEIEAHIAAVNEGKTPPQSSFSTALEQSWTKIQFASAISVPRGFFAPKPGGQIFCRQQGNRLVALQVGRAPNPADVTPTVALLVVAVPGATK